MLGISFFNLAHTKSHNIAQKQWKDSRSRNCLEFIPLHIDYKNDHIPILDHCLHGGSIATTSIQTNPELLSILMFDNHMCATTSGASIAETCKHTMEPGNDDRKQNSGELLSLAVKILLSERIIFNKFNIPWLQWEIPETYHKEKPFISPEWLVEPHAAI